MFRSTVLLPLLVGLLCLQGPRVEAEDSLRDLLAELSREPDSTARVALVRRLAKQDTSRAAAALAALVRQDPHPDVRAEAAAGLGRITADNVLELLSGLLLEGGTHSVRLALAGAFVQQRQEEALIGLLAVPQGDTLGRGLVIEALGAGREPATLHQLLLLTSAKNLTVRIAALQALANRKGAEEMLVEALGKILTTSRDTALLMAALDMVERYPDPILLPGAERVLTFLEPALQRAASHAVRHLRFEEWKRAVAAAAAEGYAPHGTPREPPGDRPRFDLIYALDGTGSVSGRLDTITTRIRERYRFLEELGSDVRVGIVVFRGHRNPEQAQVLPLTHDLTGVGEFLDGIRTGGADSQGAAVSRGLVEGLARAGWRWDAQRSVFLVADSRCHDPARAHALAALHLEADCTRVHALYLLRTRTKIPEDIEGLARVGGGAVEIIE